MSWLTYTLQYLQLKHNSDTDIYSQTKELCVLVPVNNLITLIQ